MKRVTLTVTTEDEFVVELLEAIGKVLMGREGADVKWRKRVVQSLGEGGGSASGATFIMTGMEEHRHGENDV